MSTTFHGDFYDIETVSEDGFDDYEIWTCKRCGRTATTGVGGDVACCPCEFEEEDDAS